LTAQQIVSSSLGMWCSMRPHSPSRSSHQHLHLMSLIFCWSPLMCCRCLLAGHHYCCLQVRPPWWLIPHCHMQLESLRWTMLLRCHRPHCHVRPPLLACRPRRHSGRARQLRGLARPTRRPQRRPPGVTAPLLPAQEGHPVHPRLLPAQARPRLAPLFATTHDVLDRRLSP